MSIDFLGFERQFVDHLAPVWRAMPERPRFLVDEGLLDYARSLGIGAEPVPAEQLRRSSPPPRAVPGDGPSAMVASVGDTKVGRRLGYRRFAFMEHGIGQAYLGDQHGATHPSYAGGKDREDTTLFLTPNEYSARLWRTAYPQARVEVVGCPRLDDLPAREGLGLEPTVAISFHWPAFVAPEADTAVGYFGDALPGLAKHVHLIGHAHPKGDWPEQMARVYRRAGIEFVRDFAEVCRRADLYVCDNSCVTPETLVLCADLRWRPAGDLRPGDALIGCDEEATRKGRLRNGAEVDREDRRFRTTEVVANERKTLPCRTVVTDRGTMTVSERHPYLVRRKVPYSYQWPAKGWTFQRTTERWVWVEARELAPGDEVAWVADPWTDASDRDSGWLAGMFDGEGNLNITASRKEGSQHRRLAISVAQNRGAVLDEFVRLLDDRALPYVAQGVRGSAKGRNCVKLTIGGRLFERLRLLGELRPVRLLGKALREEVWEGANVSAAVSRATVQSVEDVGEREVCVMQTTTKTFIADGFMAHNSTIYEFAATGRPVVVMNSPRYRRNVTHGLRFWEAADVGVQVDRPEDLLRGIQRALRLEPEDVARREAALDIVYAARSDAAGRAASALVSWDRAEVAA